MNNPRVTVLMSVYNGEKFLKEAIDSILAQTYTNFEFVIYDDCSTDMTSSIIKSYDDSRIVYRKNDVNQGLTKNLADGVSRSKADYIARMDADDIAYPERLEKQIKWMDEHLDITILGTSVNYFREHLGDLGIAQQPLDDATIKATLLISFTMMHPSIMIRRKDLVKHELNYNPDYWCSQDHALYLDCIREKLKFANLSEPLLHMRSHLGSISRAKSSRQQECSQRARLNFLKLTGIAKESSAEELETYNVFASGHYPDTIEKVHLFESFVYKLYEDPILPCYFDKDLVRKLMADKLCNDAYHIVKDKRLRCSALEARRSSLMNYSKPWSLIMNLKFCVKKWLSI